MYEVLSENVCTGKPECSIVIQWICRYVNYNMTVFVPALWESTGDVQWLDYCADCVRQYVKKKR